MQPPQPTTHAPPSQPSVSEHVAVTPDAVPRASHVTTSSPSQVLTPGTHTQGSQANVSLLQ